MIQISVQTYSLAVGIFLTLSIFGGHNGKALLYTGDIVMSGLRCRAHFEVVPTFVPSASLG